MTRTQPCFACGRAHLHFQCDDPQLHGMARRQAGRNRVPLAGYGSLLSEKKGMGMHDPGCGRHWVHQPYDPEHRSSAPIDSCLRTPASRPQRGYVEAPMGTRHSLMAGSPARRSSSGRRRSSSGRRTRSSGRRTAAAALVASQAIWLGTWHQRLPPCSIPLFILITNDGIIHHV